jgi:uncharacterized protein (TIGR03663 family)
MQSVTTNPSFVGDGEGSVRGGDGGDFRASGADVHREGAAPARVSFLDRPLASFLRLNWETAIWIAILLVGAIARFVMLDVRAMSHDESLHTLYAYYLYANGNYDHNPMMHGPFRYHLTAFFYFLFGDNDFTARMAPAFFGMALIGLIYFLRNYIGRWGAILAAVMVTISPSLLFHSRYIRDDIFMAFWTLLWIFGAFRYLDQRKLRYLGIMVAAMAFGFATMENHFIHGAIIGAFFVGLALWQVAGPRAVITVAAPLVVGGGAWWVLHEMKQDAIGLVVVGIGIIAALVLLVIALRGKWHTIRRNDAADLSIIMLSLVLPFLAAFLHVFTGGDPQVFADSARYTSQEMIIREAIFVLICVFASVLIGGYWFWRRAPEDELWHPQFRHWAALMGFFWIVQVLFFTTFLTNVPNGLATGIVGSLGYWLAQQGVKRGNQPVYYYALIGWLYEFLPAFLSICGITTIFYKLFRRHEQRWDPVTPRDLPATEPAAQRPEVVAGAIAAETIETRWANNRLYFVVFLVWWTFGAWIGYTVAGEKMPWLFTHMALPMCILGGWWLGGMLRHVDWAAARRERTWLLVFAAPLLFILGLVLLVATSPNGETETARRILQWLLIFLTLGAVVFATTYLVVRGGIKQGIRLLAVGFTAVLFVLTIRTTFMLNYINFDSATEYLVYAHASPDVKRALGEIDTISQRTVGDRNIVVAYDDESSWPLSWYMRQYPNAKFYGKDPTPEAMSAPVVIVGDANRAKVEPYMARDYVKRTYRQIWWPEMDYFNLTPDRVLGAITDPQQRDRLFNIIAFRKYRNTDDLSQWRNLAEWPYRKEFDMYVRRDLAPVIWDLNVLPMAEQAPINVPVILPEQVRTVEPSAVYAGDYGGSALLSPRAVAIGPNGERVIADTGNHRIVVLDATGNYLRSFGSFCNLTDPGNTPCTDPDGDGPLAVGDGQFYEPWGVAVDAEGNIYVADTWNGRIQVFAPDGTFLRRWGVFAVAGGEGGDPNALFGPRGLAFDLDGNLVVADTGNKRIVQFRPSGEYVNQVGAGGVIAGRFEEPTDVAVDPTNGTILVADSWNGRIQRFGADLAYQSEFAVPGWAGRDIFQKPGLAVGVDGTIFATDPATGQVVAYAPTGEVKYAFGGLGAGAGQLGLPNGIRVDLPANTLVVADGGNSRVVVFPIQP